MIGVDPQHEAAFAAGALEDVIDAVAPVVGEAAVGTDRLERDVAADDTQRSILHELSSRPGQLEVIGGTETDSLVQRFTLRAAGRRQAILLASLEVREPTGSPTPKTRQELTGVAGRGFEPLKAYAGDFTDRSLWPLGHPASVRKDSGASAR